MEGVFSYLYIIRFNAGEGVSSYLDTVVFYVGESISYNFHITRNKNKLFIPIQPTIISMSMGTKYIAAASSPD